jgi:hypothetical protein
MAGTAKNERVSGLFDDVSERRRVARNDGAMQSTKERMQREKRAMLIEAEAQAQAERDQRQLTRGTADAANQAAHGHEGETSQAAAKQARAAAASAEVAKQADREQLKLANDGHKGWDEWIGSILTATRPVAGSVLGTARLTPDRAILPTIIGPSNQAAAAPIEATDSMIKQAGKPRTLTSLGENLGRQAQAVLGPIALQSRTLQSSQETEQTTLAARTRGYQAARKGMISQPVDSPSLTRPGQVSRSVINAVGAASSASSLSAALAAERERARTTDWLKPTTRETPTGLVGNRGTEVAQSRDAYDQKPAEYARSFGIKLRTLAERRFEPILTAIMTREDQTIKKAQSINPDVRTMQAGANRASTSRQALPAQAFTAWNDNTTIRQRPDGIEGRQRFDPREIVWQNGEKLGAQARRIVLEPAPATGTRMSAVPAAGIEGTSLLAPERALGIFEPTHGATGGSSGQQIDSDRMARAIEMFIQALERFTAMARFPEPGAGRPQMAPVPPALPAKPAPFIGRTDGSGSPF